ncbi:MAG: hypothetical protein CMH83_15010 [Nocardioides sp.]|nr:hypothetical protein [Nocardioides sp.]
MPSPDTTRPGSTGPEDRACCAEFAAAERDRGVSRRGLLRGAAVAGGATVTAVHGTAFTETAYAADGVADQVLVVVSLRGAADGLSLVVPHGDPTYYAARPSIAVASDRLLVKDGFFGLHPSLAPLLPLWNSGRLAAVHAAGLPAPNRSHFSAMEELEDADPGSSERVGWLNRLIGLNAVGSPLEAIQFGTGIPSTQIFGPEDVLATPSADDVTLAGPSDAASLAIRQASLRALWSGSSSALGHGAREAVDVVEAFSPVREAGADPENGAVYPSGDLARALASAARTIKADVGAQVVTVDHGSWDHHTWIGTPDNGNLERMASKLAASLAAFFTDLGPDADHVTVVTLSEFGRRVKENANQGLDHGYGNVMLLMGAGVRGGQYYGTWPGLTNDVDADLTVTTDYRSVLSEVVTKRFGASSAAVFPGFTPSEVGALTSL